MGADRVAVVVKTFATTTRDDGQEEVTRFTYQSMMLPDALYDLEPASEKIDAWAFGTVLFNLLSASPLLPVNRDDDLVNADAYRRVVQWKETDDAADDDAMPEVIVAGRLVPAGGSRIARLIDDEVADGGARDVLKRLLDPDPTRRWTVKQAIDGYFGEDGKLARSPAAGEGGSVALDEIKSMIAENLRISKKTLTTVTSMDKKLDSALVKLDHLQLDVAEMKECQALGFEALRDQVAHCARGAHTGACNCPTKPLFLSFPSFSFPFLPITLPRCHTAPPGAALPRGRPGVL